jgi:hypothetical protein
MIHDLIKSPWEIKVEINSMWRFFSKVKCLLITSGNCTHVEIPTRNSREKFIKYIIPHAFRNGCDPPLQIFCTSSSLIVLYLMFSTILIVLCPMFCTPTIVLYPMFSNPPTPIVLYPMFSKPPPFPIVLYPMFSYVLYPGNEMPLLEWEYTPPIGPRPMRGFVGLKNAGATCYMNSVIQQVLTNGELIAVGSRQWFNFFFLLSSYS